MNIALLTSVGASILTAIAVWTAQEWKYEGIISDIKLEQSEAARRNFEGAQREYQADIERKDKAIHEATLRAQKNATLARSLDSDVDRMRDELREASARMPAESCETVRKYATTCNSILGTMAEVGAGISGKADGHSSDTIMLEEAWPSR